MAEITIITNTIRRPLDLVEKSLNSSLSQGDAISVILVDQNEEPLKLSKTITENPSFSRQGVRSGSVSSARNQAIIPQECKWIIFCDDDGFLEEGYLTKLRACIERYPEISIFAGSIKRTDTGDFYSKRHAVGGDMQYFWNLKLLMGSNFCVRREVFEELGKFDENFGAGARFGSSEETDFAWKAWFHGEKMRFSPELVVFHVPPFSGAPDFEMQKAYRYGFGKGALVRKWIGKGYLSPVFELLEMLLLPILQLLILLLIGRISEARIRISSLRGRVMGLFLGGVRG